MKSKWYKKILFCVVMVGILLAYTRNLMAFGLDVHERLTKEAILQNKASLSNYITGYTGIKFLTEKVAGDDLVEQIMQSSKMEDFVFVILFYENLYSHFYNPLTNAAFKGSGIPSAYDWANDSANRWSWSEAKLYFYQALTLTDNFDRAIALDNAFESLGHVMHLLQDVAVPAHSRLDLHGFPFRADFLESYTSDKIDDLEYTQVPYRGNTPTTSVIFAPLQLWDGDF
ncbi:MAG: hypothetical protein HQL06_06445 [Nitrospirae bacterium]|nr:hypothetical protein [Nitrospirota bacterium]